MKTVNYVAILCVATLAVSASAQKSVKSTLTKAAQYVTRCEAAVKKGNGILDKSAQSNNGQALDSAIESATNQFEQAKELLGKAEELLKSVPDSESEKSPVQKEYEGAQQSLDELKKRLDGAKTVIEKNDAVNAAGAVNDEKTIEALSDTLGLVGSDSRGSKPDIARVDLYPQIKKDIEAMIAKYGQSKGSRGANREFTSKVQGLKSQFAAFEQTRTTVYPKKKEEQINAFIKNIKNGLELAKTDELFTQFRILLPDLMDSLTRNLHVYAAFAKEHKDYNQPLVDEANALMKTVREESAKMEKKLISANTIPEFRYTDSDRDALVDFVKGAFMKRHPNAKIRKVILNSSSWARITAWRWSSSLAWYKEDVSTTDAFVVTAGENPEHVYLWATPIVRDHMQGGLQKVYLPLELGKPKAIGDIVLASKLK